MTRWTPTVAVLADLVGGRVVGAADTRVDAFGIDSRSLPDGALFVALRDERDGHEFVEAAFRGGAAAALVERDVDVPVGRAAIVVPDALLALGQLGRARRQQLADAVAVGITGSTGKTSTKDLTAAAVGAGRVVHANAASWNNEFGVPLTLLAADDDVDVLVTELGERRRGDLTYLCDIVQPSIGLVTNVGIAHAEFLGGPDGVLAVLGEIVEYVPESGVVIIDADDTPSAPLRSMTRARVLTVGDAHTDVVISDVALDADLRVSASYATPWGSTRVALPLRGVHHARNAAFALAVAGTLGVDLDSAAAALAGTSAASWRMHVTTTDTGITVINDAYNANPASMRAGLDALAALPVTGRRIAVLGEMRELGEWSTGAHREVGAHVDACRVDLLVVVGAGAEALADATREAGVETVEVATADDAIARLRGDVRAGDAVLVKASRVVGLERVAAALTVEPDAGVTVEPDAEVAS